MRKTAEAGAGQEAVRSCTRWYHYAGRQWRLFSGSLRKVRWSRAGSGKRGGVRVIYFYHDANRPLYLLLVYAKATREDLSADEKRTVRKLAAVLKGKGRQKRASEHRK